MAAAAGPEEPEPGGSFRRCLARLSALRPQPGAERPDGDRRRRTELHLLFDQLISESCGPPPAAGPSPQVPRGAAAERGWGRPGAGAALPGAHEGGARSGEGAPRGCERRQTQGSPPPARVLVWGHACVGCS